MTDGLTTSGDSSIREDLKKQKFDKANYWRTKRVGKMNKKRNKKKK